jgi:hypothetical protein
MSSDSLSACSLNSFVYLFIFFTPYIIGCFGTALLLYLSMMSFIYIAFFACLCNNGANFV